MSASKELDLTIGVDELGNQRLSGIPLDAWKAFEQQAKVHFPEAGDNAWANLISEIIVSTLSHGSYLLTDIPPEYSKALDARLKDVHWTFDQFHTYLLTSASLPSAFRIVSFYEPEGKNQQFGTVVITGLRKSTFDKIEAKTGVDIEKFFGFLMNGLELGEIKFTPEDAFKNVPDK